MPILWLKFWNFDLIVIVIVIVIICQLTLIAVLNYKPENFITFVRGFCFSNNTYYTAGAHLSLMFYFYLIKFAIFSKILPFFIISAHRLFFMNSITVKIDKIINSLLNLESLGKKKPLQNFNERINLIVLYMNLYEDKDQLPHLRCNPESPVE